MTSSGAVATRHDFHLSTHRLSYLTWENAGRPPLVLIHGGLDNAQTWQDLAVLLADQFQVFALDLRGHGDSDWSSTGDYLPPSYHADIAAFLHDVVGTPAAVVGHSMGARLALQLMGTLPEMISSVIAIEGLGAEAVPPPSEMVDEGMRGWISARVERARRSDVEQQGDWLRARIAARRKQVVHPDLESRIAKQLADTKQRLTPDQASAYVAGNMRKVDGGWVWKFDPLARWQTGHELVQPQEPYWNAIRGPILNIYGEQSWAFPPEKRALDAFRDGRLFVIPEAGHWVHLNRPEAVATAIREFLQAAVGD